MLHCLHNIIIQFNWLYVTLWWWRFGSFDGKEGYGWLQITCQKCRFKHLNQKFIYRISYKNAKKANPVKWICPFDKNDICKNLRLEILAIYCRNMQFNSKNWDGWYHRFFEPLILVDKLSKILSGSETFGI